MLRPELLAALRPGPKIRVEETRLAHEWNSEDCDCLEEPVEEGADELTIDEANREESRYLDRQNARDINRR